MSDGQFEINESACTGQSMDYLQHSPSLLTIVKVAISATAIQAAIAAAAAAPKSSTGARSATAAIINPLIPSFSVPASSYESGAGAYDTRVAYGTGGEGTCTTAATALAGAANPSYAAAPASSKVSPYDLGSCANANVSMIFRLENVHPEYFYVREFCKARGPGMHCYTPRNCTGQATVMMSCPEGVAFRCRHGFGCLQPDPTQAGQCFALIDLLPKDVWNYGPPRMIMLAPSLSPTTTNSTTGAMRDMAEVAFEVTTTGGAIQTLTPTLCRGPLPCECRGQECKCPARPCGRNPTATTCTCGTSGMLFPTAGAIGGVAGAGSSAAVTTTSC